MRRAQVDGNSQPVKNKFINPGFENTSGVQAVRTNLAIDPRMTSTALGGYGAQTITTVTGLTGQPEGITTAVRASYTAGASNAGTVFLLVPDAATQYTVSAWVYNEGSVDESIGLALKGHSSGGTQVVPPGVWTRLSWTMTTGTPSTGNDFGARIGTTAGAGSFLTTGVLVEKTNVLMPWFSGASAAADDMTYLWTGTANASSSQQRGTSAVGVTSVGVNAISSTQWAGGGTKSLRIIPSGTGTDTFAAPGGDTGAMRMGMEAGKTYTALATVRLSATLGGTLKAGTPCIQAFWRAAGGGYSSKTSATAANTIGVTQLRVTFSVPVGATEAFVRLYNGTNRTNGDVWYDNFMLVEGEYTGDYVDGSKPFSKWEGTANDSNSIGYPPQLFDFAGKPFVDKVGSGSIPTTNPASDMTGRTLYLVYESYGFTTNYQAPCIYGTTGEGRFSVQTQIAGQDAMGVRFDFPGGDQNKVLIMTTGRSTGMHVIAATVNDGLTAAYACVDGRSDHVTTTINGGTGWANNQLSIATPQSETVGRRAFVFNTYHDRNTRLAISRYLGNKYGAAVA